VCVCVYAVYIPLYIAYAYHKTFKAGNFTVFADFIYPQFYA